MNLENMVELVLNDTSSDNKVYNNYGLNDCLKIMSQMQKSSVKSDSFSQTVSKLMLILAAKIMNCPMNVLYSSGSDMPYVQNSNTIISLCEHETIPYISQLMRTRTDLYASSYSNYTMQRQLFELLYKDGYSHAVIYFERESDNYVKMDITAFLDTECPLYNIPLNRSLSNSMIAYWQQVSLGIAQITENTLEDLYTEIGKASFILPKMNDTSKTSCYICSLQNGAHYLRTFTDECEIPDEICGTLTDLETGGIQAVEAIIKQEQLAGFFINDSQTGMFFDEVSYAQLLTKLTVHGTSTLDCRELNIELNIDTPVYVDTYHGRLSKEPRIFLNDTAKDEWLIQNHSLNIMANYSIDCTLTRLGMILNYILSDKETTGLIIDGFTDGSRFINKEDLEPYRDLITSFAIIYDFVNETCSIESVNEVLQNKTIYYAGKFSELEKVERSSMNRTYEAVCVYLSAASASSHNIHDLPINSCVLSQFASTCLGLYKIMIEKDTNYWVELEPRDLI